jgi:hypothetical protein
VAVCAADTLPIFVKKPAVIIVNDQEKHLPGGHWSALFVPTRGRAEFFCSFGLRPSVNHHKKFILRNSKGFLWNDFPLQHVLSRECGKYCILFLENRMRGVSMRKFISIFNGKPRQNDAECRQLYKKLLIF